MVICSFCNNSASIRRFGKYLCQYHNNAYIAGSFDLQAAQHRLQSDTPTALPNVEVSQDGRVLVDFSPVKSACR